MKSALNIHWKDWCWSWHSNTLATWCKELTHCKRRPWCWERLKLRGEGDHRGWDSWMASLMVGWTWIWVNSRSWWWTGKSGILQSMGSQRVGHEWATELNWTSSEFCMKLKSSYQLCEHHHKASLAWESTSSLTCMAVDHRLWNSARGTLHRTAYSVAPGFLQSKLSKRGERAKENKMGAAVSFII